jgi:hypothetical protein
MKMSVLWVGKPPAWKERQKCNFFWFWRIKEKKLKASHVNIFISSIIPVWITADIL